MALAVCLLFDGRSERAIRNLWDRLEAQGVPTLRSHTHGMHRPHLSYVVLLRWDLDAVLEAVRALPDGGQFELMFDAIGSFRRGRACLIPAVCADLVARQEAVVHAVSATGALVHKHYEIGRWLPHCSLATRARLERIADVTSAAYDVLPMTVRCTRAALIDSATGQLWPLATMP